MVRNLVQKLFVLQRTKSKIRGFPDEGPYFRRTDRTSFSNALEFFFVSCFPIFKSALVGRVTSSLPFNRSFWVADSKILVLEL